MIIPFFFFNPVFIFLLWCTIHLVHSNIAEKYVACLTYEAKLNNSRTDLYGVSLYMSELFKYSLSQVSVREPSHITYSSAVLLYAQLLQVII